MCRFFLHSPVSIVDPSIPIPFFIAADHGICFRSRNDTARTPVSYEQRGCLTGTSAQVPIIL